MSPPGTAPTILIVDDTEVNVLLLQSVLDAEGFRTLTAPDGATARELSRAQIPDLILLDVVMPGESNSRPAPNSNPTPRRPIFLSFLFRRRMT